MQQNKKQPYLAPAVKVVEVKVERGMQTSFNAPGTSGETQGTEAYQTEAPTTWF